ncbi:MAG: VOC family protein [Alphaproteobacteria bacterium]|nr:VOC family protein [Alphaproteobacteria bacterium]MBU2084765.1 VOC family protein [Alphaproteobacteria bacterium]MBU2144157.1 VOC family protein [Alphaproteobacteria bacterium]MBU2198272.1 VOC family protein [Alphaproteobacteria bacterium]
MEYLHTMVRVENIDDALKFYCDGLGLEQVRRVDSEQGRFTLVFLASPADVKRLGGIAADANPTQVNIPMVELTYNWDPEAYQGGRNFGHLAYMVDDIYEAVERLAAQGVTINRPPRDGHMAFIRSPDGISVELLQKGERKPPKEPWASAENIGVW